MEELTSGEVEATVKELELKLERLRVFYEQYFLGLVKREPTVQLKECVRLIHVLDQQQIKNTAVRFRFRAILQKYNSFRSYWGRTLRAMEAGTYVRDVARVTRKMAAKGIALPAPRTLRSAAAIERAILDATEAERQHSYRSSNAEREATPDNAPPPAEAHIPPLPAASLPTASAARDLANALPSTPASTMGTPSQEGPSEEELRALYRRFLKAKTMCGESTDSIKYESLEKTIRRELPKLRDKHRGKPIEFQVVIQNGRAILRAKPKES